MTSYTKNIVTDYGAPIDGVSDTTSAWLSFTTFLSGLNAGDSVTLTVPAHTYKFIAGSGGTGIYLTPGILGGISVTINGTGAIFSDNTTGKGFFLGGTGLFNDNLHSSRIATVMNGSSTCQLLTIAENSRYSVGQWLEIAGIDLQGTGNPINPAYFEYVQITAINTSTGAITFTPALQNSYLSTWPNYQPGDAGHQDLGGPATIYALPFGWDIDATWNGVTFSQAAQTYVTGKSITFINGGCPSSSSGVVPSNCKSIMFNNFSQTGTTLELDKNIQQLNYLGGDIGTIVCQSMSVANLIIDNMTFTGGLTGCGRRLRLSNSVVPTLVLGPTSYGRCDSAEVTNCTIGTTIGGSDREETNIVSLGYTMTAGVIRIAKTYKAVPFAAPGTWCFFRPSSTTENWNNSFRVLSVTDDGTNTIITTTLSAGFPTFSGDTADIVIHPCSLWTGTGNTGSAVAVDLSQPGAQGKPLFSYSKRVYTGNTLQAAPSFKIWGNLTFIKTNVTQAYTGSQSTLTAECLGTLGGHTVSVDRTTDVGYDPIVNLKTTGLRTVLQNSVSGNVSGDVLGTGPGSIWFSGTQGISTNHDVSGESSSLWPIVEIEISSNQGIYPINVISFNFRIHS